MNFTCLEVIEAAGLSSVRTTGDEVYFLCPFHDDHRPSLQINCKKDVFLCGPCNIKGTAWRLASLFAGVAPSDTPRVREWLIEHGLSDESRNMHPEQLTKYVYTDEEGEPSFRVVRADYKKFFQQTPDGSGMG